MCAAVGALSPVIIRATTGCWPWSPWGGLAQQSPRLSEQRPPGFSLVGDRRDILRPQRAVVSRIGVGPEDATSGGAAQRIPAWIAGHRARSGAARRHLQYGTHRAGDSLDVRGSALSAIQDKLGNAQNCAADLLAGLHLPQLPTRHEIVSRATAMFAETPSMEAIVNRAQAVVLDAICARLCAMTLGQASTSRALFRTSSDSASKGEKPCCLKV